MHKMDWFEWDGLRLFMIVYTTSCNYLVEAGRDPFGVYIN